jgi:hypothetical protein
MKLSAIAMLAVCLASPALADQPLLRPSRDVEVIYRANTAAAVEQRVRWLAASQTMRIDPPTPGLYVIIDYVARRMSVVREAERSVVDMAAPEGMADAISGKGAGSYVRHGEAVVAGLPCTEWDTLDRQSHPALICITSDGVLLRAGAQGQTLVSAVSVQYVPQDPAAFRVPADYQHQAARVAR